MGRVMEIDRGSGKGLNSLFLRVRVEVSLNALIVAGMEVKRGGEKKTLISFRYEKLPNVCYWCGFLDHVERDCKMPFELEDRKSVV